MIAAWFTYLPPGSEGLYFTRAEWWPLALALPLLWILVFVAMRSRRRRVREFGAPVYDRTRSPVARATLLTLLAALLFGAWLDPRYGEEVVVVERRGLDLVFCLDTSRSMRAQDVAPDRLTRAKQDIESVLPSLVGGDRVALVAFAGSARVIAPLTHDLDSFGALLATVDENAVPRGGSDLAAALEKALEVAEADQSQTTAVVLLTDGEDLQGRGKAAAEELATAGVVLHAVGYGTVGGSKIRVVVDGEETFVTTESGEDVISVLDEDSLDAMAQVASGDYLRASSVPLPLQELKTKRLDAQQQRSFDAGEERVGKARFAWLLLPALLLLLFDVFAAGGRSIARSRSRGVA